jgi:hypothetical protein
LVIQGFAIFGDNTVGRCSHYSGDNVIWQKIMFKIAQTFGAAATTFIAVWLILHPDFEPLVPLRAFEIIGSLIAAVILCVDVLDLTPEWD